MSNVRALLLAFEFPPLASGGVHRALGLAEHLGAFGIELSVVTVRPEDYAAWSAAPLDTALAARIPRSVPVYRTPSGFPDWYWRLTRSRLGFRMLQYAHRGDPVSSFWAIDKIIAEHRPDVLLATMPPFGVAVIARQVAARYRIPWVADWRDPWTYWGAAPFPTYAHYAYARRAEGATLREANVSVATSHVTRDDWLRYFRGVDPARLVTIYNGYDESVERVAVSRADGVRTILYVGSWYYDPRSRATMMQPAWRRAPQRWLFYTPRREDWLYRSPYFFLRGLAKSRSKPRVEFAGAIPQWLPSMLRETKTEGLVTLRGPVAHDEALRLQRSASALLLTSAKIPGGRDYSIAGKTFEYFGLRRPILGVLTDGAMRDLVEQSGLGIVADPDDELAVAAAIDRIGDTLVAPRDEVLARFTRREMARQMAECLQRAAAEGYRS